MRRRGTSRLPGTGRVSSIGGIAGLRAGLRAGLCVGLCAFLVAVTSCNVDLLGFLGSASNPDGRFAESRSMPQPADVFPLADDFSFIYVSDLHIEGGAHSFFRGLKDRLGGASFIVVGGDISQNGRKADVDCFIAEAAAIGVPVYSTIGNHDLYAGGWENARAIGPSSFTVRIGNQARLVCIDTGNGTLGRSQAEWLEGTLSASAESTVIVATHMQFFTGAYFETQQITSPEETAAMISQYRRCGVDLSLSGHSHKFDDRMIGALRYAVSPSFLDHSGNAGYLVVTCAGGTLSVERKAY